MHVCKTSWEKNLSRDGNTPGSGRENEHARKVFVSSFISQTAVCQPLALLLRVCRTPNSGIFPALSPFPLRGRALPSRFPAVHQAPLNTTGDLSPPRPGTCGAPGRARSPPAIPLAARLRPAARCLLRCERRSVPPLASCELGSTGKE